MTYPLTQIKEYVAAKDGYIYYLIGDQQRLGPFNSEEDVKKFLDAELKLTPLTFQALRMANLQRLPVFKNKLGEPAHTCADGSDWKLSAWSNATLGELGELANIIKKLERGDLADKKGQEIIDLLAGELADVAIYLDILAYRCGVNLGDAVRAKFNEVSVRVGCEVKL